MICIHYIPLFPKARGNKYNTKYNNVMGFTLDDFHEKSPERDLQKYYSQLYRTTVD